MNVKPTIIRSAGETDAGSAGTQPARDSRWRWTISRPGIALTGGSLFPHRSSRMPSENPLAQGKVLWVTCLLTKKAVVQFTLNHYTQTIIH